MIDLHCHILPGIDDGAESLDEALAMARCAAADGIRRVVATPHMSGWDDKVRWRAAAGLEALQRELNLCGIKLALTCGAEMSLAPGLLKASDDERACCLNASRYLLLELPLADCPLYTDEVIFALQLRGLVPILAHPERNVVFQEHPNRLFRLVERGALGQLTASSLLSRAEPTRKAAERFLEHGLVHMLASDGHDADQRAPVLAEAVRRAGRLVGQREAKAMVTDIPAAILDDLAVNVRPPERVHARSGWRFF